MTLTAPDLLPELDAPADAASETTPRPSAARRAAQRGRTWLAVPDHATALIVFFGALVIGTWNVTGSPNFQDDEGTYVAQAVSVQNGGLAPYTYWYDHPPFGWIQLAVLGWIPQALHLGGGSDLAAMRYVAAGLFALTAMLLFLLARRVGALLPFAALAAAIFVLSPLSLTLGRQVFLDTVGMPWLLLAFYLVLSPRRALWHHVGGAIAFAGAVLSKLTLASFGPALLVAMAGRGTWRGRAFSIVGFFGVGALVLALYPVMAILRGELLAGPGHVSLQDALSYQFVSRSGSGWIWEEGSGRQQLVSGWLFIDSYLVIAGVVAAVLTLLSTRTRWIGVAIAFSALPVLASQGYLPAMYIVASLPFLALAIGTAADVAWRALHRFVRAHMPGARVGGPLLAAAVLAATVVFIPVEQWVSRGIPLLSADENRDWRRALSWVDDNVPRDEVILVPYSMWQDVDKLGWDDPWKAIVLEKVDLDTQYATEHPGGWREIQWIVEGPTVQPNIGYLGLAQAGEALDHSTVVAEFGAWRIRQVDTDAP